MAYKIIVTDTPNLTFLYNDVERALAKIRTLQRRGSPVVIRDDTTGEECSAADIEDLVRRLH